MLKKLQKKNIFSRLAIKKAYAESGPPLSEKDTSFWFRVEINEAQK